MRSALALGLLAAARAEEEAPKPKGEIPATVDGAFFFEPFLPSWTQTWKVSKDAEFNGRWQLEPFNDEGVPGDMGLVVSDQARRHAVSTVFPKAFSTKQGLVVQYELQLKKGLQCGGAYIKLLAASEQLDQDGFTAGTPYTIMFGPDKCGATNKVHFILRHKHPVTGEITEKHLVKPPELVTDTKTNLYTAIVGTDSSVQILINGKVVKSASLLEVADFEPSINPPKEISDPNDSKPSDWVDESKIPTPGAAKPDDWDEDAPMQIPDPLKTKPDDWLDDAPEMVPDESASMPGDWDLAEDGDWEAPLIPNPDCKAHGCGEWKAPTIANPQYKGKWFSPKIDNPEYRGVWGPRSIPNPDYENMDPTPFDMLPIGGVGIELWTMDDGLLFDNILITSDPAVAAGVASKTHLVRKGVEDAIELARSRDTKKEEGLLGQIKYYFNKLYYYTVDNPLVVVGTILVALIPLIYICCFLGARDEDDDMEDLATADGDDDGTVEEEPKAEEPKKKEPKKESKEEKKKK